MTTVSLGAVLEALLHGVEGCDIVLFELCCLGASVAHDKKSGAVAGHDVGLECSDGSTCLLVFMRHLKVEGYGIPLRTIKGGESMSQAKAA